MGLLDSIVGALAGGQQAQGGLGSLIGMAEKIRS